MGKRDPNIGRTLGGYRIKSRIACGSFGCVYLAHHTLLPRNAAIKLLHAVNLDSHREQTRFLLEAQILEVLQHPHILEIYEFGIEDGFPYLITAYASKGSLRDLLKRNASRPLPVDYALSILSQVGEALQFANENGILHHDLKPANILFNRENEALLADFGIAIVQTTSTAKRPTASLGTPAYMAPERFLGEVGPTSDQYSLGCIAYELVTGQLPFKASNNSEMGFKHLQETPIPPTSHNPLVPLHIEHAILKAMAKQSADRYASVEAFIHALHHPAGEVDSQLVEQTEEDWLTKAYTLRQLKFYKEALAAYDQALCCNSRSIAAYKARGFTLYTLKRYQEALADYTWATQLAPKDADAWNGKGNVLSKINLYAEAVAAYARAVQINPKSTLYYQNLGNALQSLGWVEEAQLASNMVY